MSDVWKAVTIAVLACLGAIVVAVAHARYRAWKGRAALPTGEYLTAISIVVAIAAIPIPIALTDDRSSASGPTATATPTPSTGSGPRTGTASGADFQEQAARLQEGDVSLFLEVLGEPGYRDPVLQGSDGGSELTEVAGLREWGWARSNEHMVRAVVDDADQVLAYSITTLSTSVRPPIPHLDVVHGAPMRLGDTSFSELTVIGLSPTSVTGIGLTPRGAWKYEEAYDLGNPVYRRLVMAHGSTGGLAFDTGTPDEIEEMSDQVSSCARGCSADVVEVSPLREIRSHWPITTVTVYSDRFPPELHGWVLAAEPMEEDVQRADRG